MIRECIKNLMHQCINMEQEDRFISFKELHEMIDQYYEIYNDRIEYDPENNNEYYIFIDNYSLGHPAYILLTIMTLLFAGVKKIWLECERSYEDGELFAINNKLIKHLVDEVIGRFPQIILRTDIPYEEVQKSGIKFINKNKNINHVVLLGGYSGTYWKIEQYRKDVTIHLPTAVYVWVDFSSKHMMYKDHNLLELGRYGWHELYDYECCYCKRMRKIDSDELYVGLGYYDYWDWKEYIHRLENDRNKNKNIVDITPIYLFGDANNMKKCLETMPTFLKPITSKDFSIGKIDYDFCNLLKSSL